MEKTKIGKGLIKGLKEVIRFERGRKTLWISDVEIPKKPPEWTYKQIIRLRKEVLGVSQPVFAAYLGVSLGALRGWEQGLKNPSSTARRLLQILAKDPKTFVRILKDASISKQKPHKTKKKI